MVKITYDENDEKSVKMIEDYFWYKYYVESLISDWGKEIKKYNDMEHDKRMEGYKVIENHLNKYELKRALTIHRFVYSDRMKHIINLNYLFSDIVSFNCIKVLKK